MQDPHLRQWLDGVEPIWTPLTSDSLRVVQWLLNDLLLRARTHDGRDGQGVGSRPRPSSAQGQDIAQAAQRAASDKLPNTGPEPPRHRRARAEAGRASKSKSNPAPTPGVASSTQTL